MGTEMDCTTFRKQLNSWWVTNLRWFFDKIIIAGCLGPARKQLNYRKAERYFFFLMNMRQRREKKLFRRQCHFVEFKNLAYAPTQAQRSVDGSLCCRVIVARAKRHLENFLWRHEQWESWKERDGRCCAPLARIVERKIRRREYDKTALNIWFEPLKLLWALPLLSLRLLFFAKFKPAFGNIPERHSREYRFSSSSSSRRWADATCHKTEGFWVAHKVTT